LDGRKNTRSGFRPFDTAAADLSGVHGHRAGSCGIWYHGLVGPLWGERSVMGHKKAVCPVLEAFRSSRLGPYEVRVSYRPKPRIGHFDFDLVLRNEAGRTSRRPVVTGICSKGNPHQFIAGWFDIHFVDCLDFGHGERVCLSHEDGLAEALFAMLGRVSPPGGMIMVSYVSDIVWGFESDLHGLTRQCLRLRTPEIPPSCTPLGWLLFASGCRNIKGEGYDVQGSSRLAGEMAPNPAYESIFTERLSERVRGYLASEPCGEFADLERICRANGARILKHIEATD